MDASLHMQDVTIAPVLYNNTYRIHELEQKERHINWFIMSSRVDNSGLATQYAMLYLIIYLQLILLALHQSLPNTNEVEYILGDEILLTSHRYLRLKDLYVPNIYCFMNIYVSRFRAGAESRENAKSEVKQNGKGEMKTLGLSATERIER